MPAIGPNAYRLCPNKGEKSGLLAKRVKDQRPQLRYGGVLGFGIPWVIDISAVRTAAGTNITCGEHDGFDCTIKVSPFGYRGGHVMVISFTAPIA